MRSRHLLSESGVREEHQQYVGCFFVCLFVLQCATDISGPLKILPIACKLANFDTVMTMGPVCHYKVYAAHILPHNV